MRTAEDITLVLFDIDGTLLDTRGAGKLSFVRALDAVFGWRDDLAYIRFAGATDLDVLARIAARRGRTLDRAEIDRFFEHLPRELETTTRGADLTIYPGVRELLCALSDNPRALLGLVTGNIESCARIKLARCDLDAHFVLGAFGHEHADRKEIARLAHRRASATLGPRGRFRAAFLIGDTPSDIAAAHAIGAAAVAVATGAYAPDHLRAAGADVVWENLGDTASVLASLGLA